MPTFSGVEGQSKLAVNSEDAVMILRIAVQVVARSFGKLADMSLYKTASRHIPKDRHLSENDVPVIYVYFPALQKLLLSVFLHVAILNTLKSKINLN